MIDFHCHIDLYENPGSVVADCEKLGTYVLSVTTTPRAWPMTSRIAARAPRIQTALGLHPQLALERETELSLFDELLPGARYVGEIGLDGTQTSWAEQESQLRVFRHILDSVNRAGGRIMSIHSRRAADRVLDLLESNEAGTAILHWFSGTVSELRRAIELGCWFSVGQPMLRTKRGRSLVAAMPRERVLTETDGPFGRVNGTPLHPRDVSVTEALLADVWTEPVADVRARMMASLRSLVGQTNGAA